MTDAQHSSQSDLIPDAEVFGTQEIIGDLKAERDRLRDENVQLRARISAARIRCHPGHPAYKVLRGDDAE